MVMRCVCSVFINMLVNVFIFWFIMILDDCLISYGIYVFGIGILGVVVIVKIILFVLCLFGRIVCKFWFL